MSFPSNYISTNEIYVATRSKIILKYKNIILYIINKVHIRNNLSHIDKGIMKVLQSR